MFGPIRTWPIIVYNSRISSEHSVYSAIIYTVLTNKRFLVAYCRSHNCLDYSLNSFLIFDLKNYDYILL